MNRLGVVTGMRFEADIVTSALTKAGTAASVTVLCLGPGQAAARRASERLLDEGCKALLSFGVAGGLVEGLKSGTLLLADRVMHWSDSIDTNPDWTARLSEAATKGALQAEKGNLAHSDPPAISPADKRSLHIQTKALGVDMESFAVGEAARARGVPFQMMRVVADGATRILPVSALDAMNPDGSVSTVRTLATLALRPWELGDLVRLGLQTAAARRTLRDLAFLGAPRLFFM